MSYRHPFFDTEGMPFLEQIAHMSRSGLGSVGCLDHENPNREPADSLNTWSPESLLYSPSVKHDSSNGSYLGSWNLGVSCDLDKSTNLDSDYGMVMLNPLTMAPVKVENEVSDDPVDIFELPSSLELESLEDLPECSEELRFDDEPVVQQQQHNQQQQQQHSVVVQPESAVTVPHQTNLVLEEQAWNHEVVLIQIAPTSKSNGTSALKVKNTDCSKNMVTQTKPIREERFEKPPFSYSCLIALALKNSESGFLPVSEIYSFILENFPFFRTAPDGWKNSIRHNLSLNKCFQKLETPSLNGTTRKACLWGLNEDKIARLDEDILKWTRRTPDSKHVLSSYKTEWHEKVGNGEVVSKALSEEAKVPVVVPSNPRPTTYISSLAEQSDLKVFKIYKVTPENNHQQPCKPPEFTVKKEPEAVVDVEPIVVQPVVLDLDLGFYKTCDPMVGGLNAQNGLYDDLTETGELREALKSFSSKATQSSPQSNHR